MNSFESIENHFSARLNQRGMSVRRGFDDEVAEALRQGAKDVVNNYYTQDIARFATIDAVHEWRERAGEAQTVYSLADSAIAGVIWFTPSESEFSHAPMSFAIRVYEDYRGRGLAGDFLEAAHLDFAAQSGHADTWLSVRLNNQKAKDLYIRHRYQISGQTDQSLIMTRRSR